MLLWGNMRSLDSDRWPRSSQAGRTGQDREARGSDLVPPTVSELVPTRSCDSRCPAVFCSSFARHSGV